MNNLLRKENISEYKVLLYLFLFSISYSLSFYGWNEATEWSYIYSNKFEISEYNNHYIKAFDTYSLLYILPTYLFDIGINKYVINYIILLTINLVAFFGVFFLSKLIFGKQNIATYVLITFLFVSFIDKHGYDLVYPNNYWVFGQFGCYLSILTISTNLLNHKKLSFFLLFLLFGTHLVWFSWTTLFFISYVILNRTNFSLKLFFVYLFLFILVVFLFKDHFLVTLNYLTYDLNTSVNKLTFDGHNIQIRQESLIDTILFSMNYFRSDILLMVIFYYLYKKNIFIDLVKVITFLTLILFLMKMYDAIDFNLVLLNKLNLAGLYIRAIPERFFNFNVILLHLILIGTAWQSINRNYNIKLLLVIFFIALLFLYYLGIRENFRSNLTLQFFILILIFSFIFKNKLNFNILLNKNTQISKYFNSILLLNFFSLIFLLNFFYSLIDGRFNQFDSLKNEINERSINKLILGPYVLVDDFTPILDLEVEGIVPEQSIQVDNEYLYCNPNQKWNIWYDGITECFNNKTKKDWESIKKYLDIKYILYSNAFPIINDNVKILKKGNKFNLYEIK